MVRAAQNSPELANVTNGVVAARLEEAANLLAEQGANEFRVRAYRRGAETLRTMTPPVAEAFRNEGERGLLRLPGVGPSLAASITKILTTGRMPVLERLRRDAEPARILTTVADIGPKLAERIHEELGIQTLADLEAASWDGRLARVPGMGPKRLRAVRESLAGRFHSAPRVPRPAKRPATTHPEPPVGVLLEIDEEYRRLAERDRLVRVAPRRFNPEHRAWLPILHTERSGERFTAMFSNTVRAHELDATHDWVVIFRERPAHSGTWTVITSRLGKLKGRRVVRGRETECAKWYAAR
jgi:Holliday junction resolvasome RuvABC DNA-binding subunit